MKTFFTFRDKEGKGKTKLVQTEEDARNLTPITARVLALDKYQSAVKDLRTAVQASPVGIVNFVTGRESSEIIDAVMVSAFPPSIGQVYQGDRGGYGIDCSTWGDTDHCSARLVKTLNGNPKHYLSEDLKTIDTLKNSFKHGDEVVERFISPASESSGDFLQPTQQGNQTPQQKLEQRTKIMESLTDVRKKVAQLDPVSNGKDRRHWVNLLHFLELELSAIEEGLPHFVTDHGVIDFDGSGFMDYEIRIEPLMRTIDNLSDEKKLDKTIDSAASQNMSKGLKPSVEVTPQERKMIAQMLVQRVLDRLKDLKDTTKPETNKHIDSIMEIFSGGTSAISKKKKQLARAKDSFYRSLKNQEKILILQNVTDSCLVQWPQGSRPGHCGDGNPVFAFRPILKNDFVKQSCRGQDRCIVFMSQEPIDFTIDGVEKVSLEGGVSEEEAEALVKYFKREWELRLRESGQDASALRMRQGDSDKVKLLITGVSHEEAVRRLMNAFHMSIDTEEMILEGQKVVKSILELGNQYAEARAEGGSKGFNFITPGVGKKDYIYREDSDWGEFCTTIKKEVATVQRLWDVETALREEERVAEEDANSSKVRAVRKKIAAVNGRVHSTLEDIPHFLIVYGEASSGKSSFAEMMADLLDFRLVDVDLTQARGMYVGQTEGQSRAMIEAWKNMSNVVLRLDEIDGQMATDADAARNSHNASVIKQLLAFFNDNIALLNARHIFVIATTNNPQLIRSQMMNRAVTYEVPLPLTKKGYYQFLINATDRLKKAYTKGFLWGEFTHEGVRHEIYDNESSWKTVSDMWKMIDVDRLAAKLDGKRIDFRNLIKLLRASFGAFERYVHSREDRRVWFDDRETYLKDHPGVDPNDCPEPTEEGFEMTTENMEKVIDLTEIKTVRGFGTTADGQQSVVSFGVSKLERQLRSSRKSGGAGETGQMELFENIFSGTESKEDEEVDLLTMA